VILGVQATTETTNSYMMRLGLLQYDDPISPNDDNEFVPGLYLESLPSFARNYNLILCRKCRFGHRFTFYQKVNATYPRVADAGRVPGGRYSSQP